jgi:hypothetical protein
MHHSVRAAVVGGGPGAIATTLSHSVLQLDELTARVRAVAGEFFVGLLQQDPEQSWRPKLPKITPASKNEKAQKIKYLVTNNVSET